MKWLKDIEFCMKCFNLPTRRLKSLFMFRFLRRKEEKLSSLYFQTIISDHKSLVKTSFQVLTYALHLIELWRTRSRYQKFYLLFVNNTAKAYDYLNSVKQF